MDVEETAGIAVNALDVKPTSAEATPRHGNNAWLAFVVFAIGFQFYLRQTAPSVTAGDSGEFITAAGTLSLPHAPSFPLYWLMGKIFVSAIRFGSVAYRVNVFSAVSAAAVLALLFLAARRLRAPALSAFVFPFLIGFANSFWTAAVTAEVFALHALLTAALVLLMLKLPSRDEENQYRWTAVIFFLLGLGLGNHHTLILIVPSLAVCGWSLWRRQSWKKALVVASAAGLLGFSVYAALPVRSQNNPPLNWGQPTTAHRLVRTVTRQDYGSFRMATGESPARSWATSARQIGRYFHQMSGEVPWPLLAVGAIGLCLGLFLNAPFYAAMAALFLVSGPFFFWLSNLPFTAQSEGIMGRFMILPTMAVMTGFVAVSVRYRRVGFVLIALAVPWMVWRGFSEKLNHRWAMLVLDYGRAMLRTMPPNAILFMDGGDDAFYGLAMLKYVDGRRPDVALHDRGGLVFKNIYGDDFRTLTKEKKEERRRVVESSFLGRRPLFYATMNTEVLPGESARQTGFLLNVGPPSGVAIDWNLLILRSLHPLTVDDYRTRALAAFFPYMRGRMALSGTDMTKSAPSFRHAWNIGKQADWLKTNLIYEYAASGYRAVQEERWEAAEQLYGQWIAIDPENPEPRNNLGVVFERTGRWDAAIEQYQTVAEKFPGFSDAMYNLAVIHWKSGRWTEAKKCLEETLRRNPNHRQAAAYRAILEDKMKGGSR